MATYVYNNNKRKTRKKSFFVNILQLCSDNAGNQRFFKNVYSVENTFCLKGSLCISQMLSFIRQLLQYSGLFTCILLLLLLFKVLFA